MTRRVARLTPDRLADLAGLDAGRTACTSCVFWELDPVRRSRLAGPEEAAEEKQAWLSEVLREWGSCGRVALLDDRPIGYAIYAPAALVPGAAGFATAPASPDAVLLTSLRVGAGHTGGGVGRLLVQAMARDLIERGGVRAVEAFATVDGSTSCAIPAGFLAHVGFRTHRPHPRTPRMRMDLRSVLTWREEVEAALERLLGAVRPRPVPAPDTPAARLRRTPRAP